MVFRVEALGLAFELRQTKKHTSEAEAHLARWFHVRAKALTYLKPKDREAPISFGDFMSGLKAPATAHTVVLWAAITGAKARLVSVSYGPTKVVP